MKQVFISHRICAEDSNILAELKDKLKHHNISFNDLDALSANSHLSNVVMEQIDDSAMCVFIVTEQSLSSTWCQAEVGAFWGSAKEVFVYCPNTKLINDERIPPQLRGQLIISDLDVLVRKINNVQGNPAVSASEVTVSDPQSKLVVKFGRIDCNSFDQNTLVVLSISDDLDFNCVRKVNTAIGAYCSMYYGNSDEAVKALQESAPCQSRPNASRFPRKTSDVSPQIMLAPITKHRDEGGYASSPDLIHGVLRDAKTYMLNNNMSKIVMPLLGTGQANLSKPVCLVSTLLAIQHTGLLRENNVAQATIVIYQSDESSVPEIKMADVFALLKTFYRTHFIHS